MLLDFQDSVVTRIDDIKEFIDRVSNMLSDYIKDDDVLFDLRLILNELTINSALHGNRLDPGKIITVYIHMIDSEIRIIVKDQGSGVGSINTNRKMNSEFMGGRGLHLVDALVDEFETCYNRVMCVKYLN